MKCLAFVLLLVASPALAESAPKPPEPPKPVLTVEEGKQLYAAGMRAGVAQGMANAEAAAATQAIKPIIEKLKNAL